MSPLYISSSIIIDCRRLCDKSFTDDLIVVPDTVTFSQARFLCSVLSGQLFTTDHPTYPGDSLYNKIKSELNLDQSFCALPSGEFSSWLGNTYDYSKEKWSGFKGAMLQSLNLSLIKEPSSPQVCGFYFSDNFYCCLVPGNLPHQ